VRWRVTHNDNRLSRMCRSLLTLKHMHCPFETKYDLPYHVTKQKEEGGERKIEGMIHIYTHIHSYTHTLIHYYTHTLIHSYTHTLLHSYTHTLIHSANAQILMYSYTDVLIYVCNHTVICYYTHILIYSYSRTYH